MQSTILDEGLRHRLIERVMILRIWIVVRWKMLPSHRPTFCRCSEDSPRTEFEVGTVQDYQAGREGGSQLSSRKMRFLYNHILFLPDIVHHKSYFS